MTNYLKYIEIFEMKYNKINFWVFLLLKGWVEYNNLDWIKPFKMVDCKSFWFIY